MDRNTSLYVARELAGDCTKSRQLSGKVDGKEKLTIQEISTLPRFDILQVWRGFLEVGSKFCGKI